jgi:hypothetical protein
MLDEEDRPWTAEGVLEAVRALITQTNTLFDDLIKNLENHPDFRTLVEQILLRGESVPYVISNPDIALGVMFGIFSREGSQVRISNRIFEMYIYEYLISIVRTKSLIASEYADKSQYIRAVRLDMETVLRRFAAFIRSEYRQEDSRFLERQGRLLFLTYLRPILNGKGHYAVEAQTRENTRMDVVVFFGSEEFIVELKIWHGAKRAANAYDQLTNYLDARGVQKGYLLSFCENQEAPHREGPLVHNGHDIFEVVVSFQYRI